MNKEILTVVEVVSNEKGVAKDIIFEALEAALASATKRRFREDVDVRVAIDRATGDYEAFRRWQVVEDAAKDRVAAPLPPRVHDLEDEVADTSDAFVPDRQILLSQARETPGGIERADIEIGHYIEEPIEASEFGRIAAQTAKQVIVQKVRDAERAQVLDAYQDRKGQLVTGTVKRVERGNVILDLGGNAEALIAKEEMLPREIVRPGDRLRGYLRDVRPEKRGPQLFVAGPRPIS